MLRITEHQEQDSAVRFRLDGTVSSESYRNLEKIIAQHQGSRQQTIILDMTGVDFVTDEPARQLAKLSSESIRIINCSPFILTLLETLNSDGAGK